MPTPMPLDVASAVSTLATLGVLPVITVGAVIGLAVMLYKRFRK